MRKIWIWEGIINREMRKEKEEIRSRIQSQERIINIKFTVNCCQKKVQDTMILHDRDQGHHVRIHQNLGVIGIKRTLN
jgi:hypothetical protein